MIGITRFGLDAPRITLVFIIAIILAGLGQFLTFPRQEDPPIVIREVVVSAAFPGMKAEDVEELITRSISGVCPLSFVVVGRADVVFGHNKVVIIHFKSI